MKGNYDHYYGLADRLFIQNDLTNTDIIRFAEYRRGKSFSDLQHEVNEGLRRGITYPRVIHHIGLRLKEIIEIHPQNYEMVYGRPVVPQELKTLDL